MLNFDFNKLYSNDELEEFKKIDLSNKGFGKTPYLTAEESVDKEQYLQLIDSLITTDRTLSKIQVYYGTRKEIFLSARTYGKDVLQRRVFLNLKNMTKEEKLKILIDWLRNLDEVALDNLLEEFINE